MKKILSMMMALVMFCSITAFTVNAKSANDDFTLEMTFLNEYLHDLQLGDFESALKHTEDTRFDLNANIKLDKLNSKQLSYVKYIKDGGIFKSDYLDESITEYKILEGHDNIVTARIIFSNGHEAIIPFHIAYRDDDYKIKINTEDISNYGYKSIKNTNTIIESKTNSPIKATNKPKDEYKFSYLYGTIYGIDSFSVSKNGIKISGYQANDMIESGWEKKAEVIYSIVERHWYGDYVWASTGNAIVKNGNFNIQMVGKNKSQKNLRIRISNQTQANPRSKGNGKIYSISI